MADPTITTPTALRRIQLGQETTPGNSVAATIKFPGKLTLKENVKLHRPNEETGTLADRRRTSIVGEEIEGTLEIENACYSTLPYLLNMAIKKKATPDTVTPLQAKHLVDAAYTDLVACVDSDEAVVSTISVVAATDKLLICGTAKFTAVRIVMGSTINAVASVVSIKTSDGDTTWTAATLVRDTTAVAGATLAQSGIIEFTPDATWASDTVDSDAGYWIEITFSGNTTASIKIAEIYLVPMAPVWTFSPTLTSADAPMPFTIEYGDAAEEHEASYVIGKDLEMKIAMNEPLSAKVGFVGQALAVSSFTGSLSLPSRLETILAKKAMLYIDALGGTIGDTPKAAILIDATFRVNGFSPSYHGSASLYYDSLDRPAYHCELDMTLQFNSDAVAQRLIYEAATQQLFRLMIAGTTISGSTTHKLTIDMCGVYTDFSTLDERDGADIVHVKIEGELNSSTWAKLFEIVVINKECKLD